MSARPDEPPSPPGRTELALFLLFLSIYLASTPGHLFGTDQVAVYRTAESLLDRGRRDIDPMPLTLSWNGRSYSGSGLGHPVALIPLVAAGRAVDRLAPPRLKHCLEGVPLGRYGGTVPIFFAGLLNPVVSALLAALLFRLGLELGLKRREALGATLLFGFGTLAWAHARDAFQHPLESLCLFASVYVLVSRRERLTLGHAFLAGTCLAYGVLTRLNVLIAVPPLCAYLFLAAPGEPAAPARTGGTFRASRAAALIRDLVVGRGVYLQVFLVPVFLTLAVIAYSNARVFGPGSGLRPAASQHALANPLWIGLYGNLASPGRSVFLYSPPILLGLVGWRTFHRRRRREALLFLAIALVYLLVYSKHREWDAGWSWGQRYLLATLPYLVLPAGFALDRPLGRAAAWVLGLLGASVQVLGIVVSYSYVHWAWLKQGLTPEKAYLYLPEDSPLPTHLRALLAGQHLDFWLLQVYRQCGGAAFLLALTPLLGLFALSIAWLRSPRAGRSTVPHTG